MKNLFLITILSLLASAGLALAKDQRYQVIDGSGSDIEKVDLRLAASEINAKNQVDLKELKFLDQKNNVFCGKYAEKGAQEFQPFIYDGTKPYTARVTQASCP